MDKNITETLLRNIGKKSSVMTSSHIDIHARRRKQGIGMESTLVQVSHCTIIMFHWTLDRHNNTKTVHLRFQPHLTPTWNTRTNLSSFI